MEDVTRWRALITGGGGFIGFALARTLIAKGALVAGVDTAWPPDLPYADFWHALPWDVRDTDQMETLIAAFEPTHIFHLAALSQVTEVRHLPSIAFDVNAGGTVAVLEAARRQASKARIVVSTSDKVYGEWDSSRITAMDEQHPLAPKHPYDAAKAAADLMAQSYATFYGMDVRVARLCNVYGPGDRNRKRLVPSIIASVVAGEPPVLRSDGQLYREYLYLNDAIEGLLAVANAALPDVWNLGGARKSVMDVYDAVMAEMVRRGFLAYTPEILDAAHDETRAIGLDSSKARFELGWTPRVSFEHGVVLTVIGTLVLMGATNEPTD